MNETIQFSIHSKYSIERKYMPSIDHPIGDVDGTSSFIHSSSGISLFILQSTNFLSLIRELPIFF